MAVQALAGWLPVILQMAAVMWLAVPPMALATGLSGLFRSDAIWSHFSPELGDLVIARNEAPAIARCLDSVPFAAENAAAVLAP